MGKLSIRKAMQGSSKAELAAGKFTGNIQQTLPPVCSDVLFERLIEAKCGSIINCRCLWVQNVKKGIFDEHFLFPS